LEYNNYNIKVYYVKLFFFECFHSNSMNVLKKQNPNLTFGKYKCFQTNSLSFFELNCNDTHKINFVVKIRSLLYFIFRLLDGGRVHDSVGGNSNPLCGLCVEIAYAKRKLSDITQRKGKTRRTVLIFHFTKFSKFSNSVALP